MSIELPGYATMLFVLTHLLLGLPPLRTLLRQALGEQRFVALFSFTAAAALTVLAISLYRAAPVPAPAFIPEPMAWLRYLVGSIAWLGLTLALAALPGYPKTPMALFQTQVHEARGISKISRHSFFVGFAAFAFAHSLLVSHQATWIMLIGFGVLSLLGALIQDRKLLMRHGASYRHYMQTTSILPLWALLRRRTALTPNDRIAATIGRAALAASLIVLLHPLWQVGQGAALPLLLAFGGFYLSLRRWQSARRNPIVAETSVS